MSQRTIAILAALLTLLLRSSRALAQPAGDVPKPAPAVNGDPAKAGAPAAGAAKADQGKGNDGSASSISPTDAPKPGYSDVGGWVVDEKDQKAWLVPFTNISLDAQGFAGPGVSRYMRNDGTGLQPGFVASTLRLGLRGKVVKNYSYFLLFDMGSSNAQGPLQTPVFRGGFIDAFIGYRVNDLLQFRLGHYTPPFGIEGTRGLPAYDFIRQSRTSALATGKDTGLTVFGYPGPFFYAISLLNGEGNTLPSVDGRFGTFGRLVYRVNPNGTNRAQLGVSGSLSGGEPSTTFRAAPLAGLSTERQYPYWSNTYLTNTGVQQIPSPPTEINVMPSGPARQFGLDAIVQLGDLDLQTEAFFMDLGRREASRNAFDADQVFRTGALSGFGYYATVNYWLTRGRMLRPVRWVSAFNEPVPPQEPFDFRPAIAVRARVEQQFLDYDSISRSPQGTLRGLLDTYTTRLRSDSLQVALAVWFNKYIRVQAQYGLFYFPADRIADRGRGSERRLNNQALAPGAVTRGEAQTRPPTNVPADIGFGEPKYYQPYDINARELHEFVLNTMLLF